jgi:hypothetical protein
MRKEEKTPISEPLKKSSTKAQYKYTYEAHSLYPSSSILSFLQRRKMKRSGVLVAKG